MEGGAGKEGVEGSGKEAKDGVVGKEGVWIVRAVGRLGESLSPGNMRGDLGTGVLGALGDNIGKLSSSSESSENTRDGVRSSRSLFSNMARISESG